MPIKLLPFGGPQTTPREKLPLTVEVAKLLLHTQEADRPDRSTSMSKVVVGGPQVLKVFSWIFIYIFHKNMVLGPKKSVKPG